MCVRALRNGRSQPPSPTRGEGGGGHVAAASTSKWRRGEEAGKHLQPSGSDFAAGGWLAVIQARQNEGGVTRGGDVDDEGSPPHESMRRPSTTLRCVKHNHRFSDFQPPPKLVLVVVLITTALLPEARNPPPSAEKEGEKRGALPRRGSGRGGHGEGRVLVVGDFVTSDQPGSANDRWVGRPMWWRRGGEGGDGRDARDTLQQ